MILYPGVYQLKRDDDGSRTFSIEYASATASQSSYVKAWSGDGQGDPVEHALLSPGGTHTWWTSNPLLTERQHPPPGGLITIEVGLGAILRIECDEFTTIFSSSPA